MSATRLWITLLVFILCLLINGFMLLMFRYMLHLVCVVQEDHRQPIFGAQFNYYYKPSEPLILATVGSNRVCLLFASFAFSSFSTQFASQHCVNRTALGSGATAQDQTSLVSEITVLCLFKAVSVLNLSSNDWLLCRSFSTRSP